MGAHGGAPANEALGDVLSGDGGDDGGTLTGAKEREGEHDCGAWAHEKDQHATAATGLTLDLPFPTVCLMRSCASNKLAGFSDPSDLSGP